MGHILEGHLTVLDAPPDILLLLPLLLMTSKEEKRKRNQIRPTYNDDPLLSTGEWEFTEILPSRVDRNSMFCVRKVVWICLQWTTKVYRFQFGRARIYDPCVCSTTRLSSLRVGFKDLPTLLTTFTGCSSYFIIICNSDISHQYYVCYIIHYIIQT